MLFFCHVSLDETLGFLIKMKRKQLGWRTS